MDAERFLGDDGCCFLLKIRLALELWCHDFADLHGITLTIETTLAEKLELLSNQKVFPDNLLQQLMQLRQHTNQAVHIQQDLRGRHITMQPLERAQQTAMLKCLFDLVCYTKRYQQPDYDLPLWRAYPKQNVRLLVESALDLSDKEGDASVVACVQLTRLLLAELEAAKAAKAPSSQLADLRVDMQYWLSRGLRLGLRCSSLEALNQLTVLVYAKNQVDFDLALLSHWLKQYQHNQPSAALDYLSAQVLERQNQLEKALKSYDKAAHAGHHGALKRLIEYWGSRCQDRLQHYLQQGLKYNEPTAMLINMALMLVDASQTQHAMSVSHTDVWLKNLKGQLVKARGMGLAGLGYIDGICHHLGILDYAKDEQLAAQLLLDNFHKVPAYCKAALNTFYLLFSAEQYHSALKVAPKALAQLDNKAHCETIAMLEFDIAMSLLKLHQLKTPVEFFKTPRELLNSAARRGYSQAILFINNNAKQIFSNSHRSGRNTIAQSAGIPAWATKLANRGAKVTAVEKLAVVSF